MLLKIEFSSLVFEDDVDETWGRCTSASLARPILWLSRWLWPMLCPWPVSEVMSGDGSVLTFAWPLSLSSSGLIGTRLESMAWVWPCSASWWEDDGDHGSRGHSDDGAIWYPSWLELVSTEENVCRFQVSVNYALHVTVCNTHQNLVDIATNYWSS